MSTLRPESRHPLSFSSQDHAENVTSGGPPVFPFSHLLIDGQKSLSIGMTLHPHQISSWYLDEKMGWKCIQPIQIETIVLYQNTIL